MVTLSPGDTRSAYVAYAIRQSDRPAAMQIAFGVNLRAETGEWPLAPSTSAHVAREVAAVPTVSSAAPAPPEAAAAREVDLWLGKLTSVDVEQRQVAALALSRNLDDPRARDALIGVLKDPDFEVRTHAVRGLRDLADPALINAFRAVLQDPQPILRVDAIRGLLAIGDEEAVAALKSALSDSDPEVRHKAQIALAELGTA